MYSSVCDSVDVKLKVLTMGGGRLKSRAGSERSCCTEREETGGVLIEWYMTCC